MTALSDRPVLVDLCCGAGGATKGYQRAGFFVIGVDIKPQMNYCGDEFIQDDALDFMNRWLDDPSWLRPVAAWHASPPCPRYAPVTRWRGNPDDHPDLLPPIRDLLIRTRKPWVIENVHYAPMTPNVVLCGSHVGLAVRRHRWFESPSLPFALMPPCRHLSDDLPFMHKNERAFADAMGCTWMSNREARDAVPPAYTEWIGAQILDSLEFGA